MILYSNANQFVLCSVVFVCLLIAGCQKGPNTATVTGTVTLDTHPTEGITVQFSPERGRPGYGVTDASGHYKIRFLQNSDGCIPGPNIVSLEAYSDINNPLSQFLPKRYNEQAVDNPEMHVDVKPGKNVFNFDILSK